MNEQSRYACLSGVQCKTNPTGSIILLMNNILLQVVYNQIFNLIIKYFFYVTQKIFENLVDIWW